MFHYKNPNTLLSGKLDPASAEIAAFGANHMLVGVVFSPDGGAFIHHATNMQASEGPEIMRLMAKVLNQRADDLEKQPKGLILPGNALRQ